MVYRSLAILVP